MTRVATKNLNKVIDRNYYPAEEARRSNLKHRPIGLGVQGLADAFLIMGLPFECDEARTLNEDIFETIYSRRARRRASWPSARARTRPGQAPRQRPHRHHRHDLFPRNEVSGE